MPSAPKFTLGSRRTLKGQDPIIPPTSTTNLVGPSTYFQKGRSQSTGDLNRIPLHSQIKKEPAVSFAKGPKFLAQYKSTVDETYDIKTYKFLNKERRWWPTMTSSTTQGRVCTLVSPTWKRILSKAVSARWRRTRWRVTRWPNPIVRNSKREAPSSTWWATPQPQ